MEGSGGRKKRGKERKEGRWERRKGRSECGVECCEGMMMKGRWEIEQINWEEGSGGGSKKEGARKRKLTAIPTKSLI